MKTTFKELQTKGYKKTNIRGLYLTIDGKAWHKLAKREITATPNGKIRFNGKLYDLQKLIDNVPITKQSNQKTKHRITINELQTKGYKKTTVAGLYLMNSGKAYNYTTKRECTPTTRGNVVINAKAYNLAKLVLETFKKTPVRTGKILFLNGNDQDFDFKNLEYATGIHYKAPLEASIVNCIRLYFEVPKKFTRSNIFYKYYLNEIAMKRGFIHLYQCADFNLFLEWLKPFAIQSQSKAEISTGNGYTVRTGTNAINKYLELLVHDCLRDQESGLLKMKDFEPKPLTTTEKIKQANETLKNYGFTSKIPLRKSGNNAHKIRL